MAEKSDLELLQEILEEQRKQALWHDIQLHYLKCMAIAHPNDTKLPNNIRMQEKVIENHQVILRSIRNMIKELEKNQQEV